MTRFAISSSSRRSSSKLLKQTMLTNHIQHTAVHHYVHRNRMKEFWNGCCGVTLLLFGLFLGHYHGRYYSFETNFAHNVETSLLLPYYHEIPHEKNTGKTISPTNMDGWSLIDVYYGYTDYVESKLNSSQKWFAQGRQDEAVLALLAHATDNRQSNGTKVAPIFVDLAANDATALSNTYALERFHGWKGWCIEPNPVYWYNLTHYRPNCKIVGAVVGGVETARSQEEQSLKRQRQQVPFRYDAGDHGGIVGTGFDNGPKWKRQSVMEYTIKLEDIFEKYNLPSIVDYVSIDVEGSEEWILMNFPFQKYKFRCFTIERAGKRPNLVKRLEEFGYKSLIRLTRWGDSLWAHEDTIRGLTQEQLSSFLNEFDAAKIRRDRTKENQLREEKP